MEIEKKYKAILYSNIIVLVLFTLYYLVSQNYEFLVYVAVIVFFLLLVLFSRKHIEYPVPILWGLSIWAFLHMSGGTFYLGDTRLYDLILFPLIEDPYNIIRYDQLVHAFGFGITTLVVYYLLKPHITKGVRRMSLVIVIVMAGVGAGAVNEILEFITVLITPNNGVGGYINTSLDTISNLVGALIAGIYIFKNEDKL